MKSSLLFGTIGFVAAGLLATSFVFDQSESSYEPRVERTGEAADWNGAMEYYKLFRANPETGEVSQEDILRALKGIKGKSRRDADPIGLQMKFRGPDNVGGRTRCMLITRDDSTKILAGSVSGGVFVSTNEAATWEPHPDFNNDDSLSSIVSAMVQAPDGRIWVGTGSSFDIFGNATGIQWPGRGIAIGDKDGNSFTYLPSTGPAAPNATNGQWSAVNRIDFDPNSNRVYACTHRGLWFTEDDGETWTNPLEDVPGVATRIAMDIKVGSDGSVVCSVGGRIYTSPNGDVGTFTDQTGNGFVGAPYARVALTRGAPGRGQEDVMHAICVANDFTATLEGIYRSVDGGQTWSRLSSAIPDYFTPLSGAGGQGVYNLAIQSFPDDAFAFLIGGVELWKFEGGLSRLTGEGFSEFSPFFVHADKHYFYFSPFNDRTLYVCSDGGMSRSEDRGTTFGVVNKGYYTSQYYGIAFSNDGVVMGGTQDNGTHAMLANNPFDPLVGSRVFGNDGFDAEISQIDPQLFATSQNGLVIRLDASNFNGTSPLPQKEISVPYTSGNFIPAGNGPFWTVIKLWESPDDPTSQDSILFNNDSTSLTIEVGNGVKRAYAGTLTPIQSAAKAGENSLRIYTGNLKVLEDDGQGNLIGNGTGTVTYNPDGTISYDFTLNSPPSLNLSVISRFTTTYEANDVLDLLSATNNIPFQHVISSDLRPGDQVTVRDPVQSVLLMSITGGFALGRGALKSGDFDIDWIPFTDGISGNVTCADFSKDGDVLFVGTSQGNLYRITGINDLYEEEDRDLVTTVTQVTSSGGTATGVSVGYNDANRVVVTFGGYGRNSGYVQASTNALGAATFTDKQGDLPPMPVYDPEIDANDPNIVLFGTEFGVWATRDITAGSPEYSDENNGADGWTYVPTYDVRQQKLGFGEASNFYNYYFGTHGRGIWESASLAPVGIEGPEHSNFDTDVNLNFTVFPNPVVGTGTISFELNEQGVGQVRIFDLNGRLVRDFGARAYSEGVNTLSVNAGDLKAGTYLVTFEGLNQAEVTKFVILN